MDFSLSKEQQDIIKAAREFARKEFREVALEFDRTETFDLNLWKRPVNWVSWGSLSTKNTAAPATGFWSTA
jgi:alkylation response protein AidB-like acyl-CoA dehydrogenase